MTNTEIQNRMRWASRRGLLELDLLLGPFVEEVFPLLDGDLQEAYRALMSCDDQDILNWIMDRAPISNASLAPIVIRIREHNGSKLKNSVEP